MSEEDSQKKLEEEYSKAIRPYLEMKSIAARLKKLLEEQQNSTPQTSPTKSPEQSPEKK